MRGLLVDWRPGVELCQIVPDGPLVRLLSWREEDEIFIGKIESGEELPVIEVRTADGRILKMEMT